jgi:hypothetical protein
MSFTRFRYDKAREEKYQQQSSDPGRWVLNVPGNGDTPAFMEDPHIRLQRWGGNLAQNPLAIEDDLRGMTRNLNRDNVDKDYKSYAVPYRSNVMAYPANETLTVDQSRATHPAWMVRGVAKPRWEIPLEDPQAHTTIPFQHNVGTRMGDKDAYDMVHGMARR